jgi:putative endonuclease
LVKAESKMVGVVQLVRTPDCDSGGRGFEPHHLPKEVEARHRAFFMAGFFCYVLESESSSRLYIGQTNDLEDRIRRHNAGLNLSTKNRGPWRLLHAKSFSTRMEAVAYERYLKSLKSPSNVRSWTLAQ